MKQKPTDYRNRIKALEYVNSADLVAHPGNWRGSLRLANHCNLWYDLIVSKDNQNAISKVRAVREQSPIYQQPNLRQMSQDREQETVPYRRMHDLDRGGGSYVSKPSPLTKRHLIYQLSRVRGGIAQALGQGRV